MKLSSAIILVSIAGTSAFTAPAAQKKTLALRMADEDKPVEMMESMAEETPSVIPETTKSSAPEMSAALPFMSRPAALDGSLVGDVGFDPLGFAKSKEDLMNYREAEIKHARLAMLAAAGWPLSELFDKKIAGALNLSPVLDATDKAPSVLNGGLEKISPVYWVGCLLAAGAIDFYGINKSKNDPNYTPGNLGFDPLGLYPSDKAGQERMQLTELKNGRLAMIAITAFAAQEFVTNLGVVDATPFFFKPIGQVLHDYTNYGYLN